jgi:hypothetical protein
MSYRPATVALLAAVLALSCQRHENTASSPTPVAAPTAAARLGMPPTPAEPTPPASSATAEGTTGRVMEPLLVAGDVVPPERISGHQADLSGCQAPWPPLIIAQITIGVDGLVHSVEFLKQPPPPCIEQRMRQAINTWRYRPAYLHGRPVAVYYNITVNIHFQ